MDQSKLQRLQDLFKEMGSVLVAFSGGVDSGFLLSVAVEVLGEKALAVTALSPVFVEREAQEASELARYLGARHELLETDQLTLEGFVVNAGRRCYFCRVDLFSKLALMARQRGIPYVVDGTVVDDLSDTRPGLKAKEEEGVRSPLLEVGLTKAEVRELAQSRGMPNWDKPSESCLASRIPIGTPVTFALLDKIARAEEHLHALGFRHVRVRHHGAMARIEVGPEELSRFADGELRQGIVRRLKEIGYGFVTLDLEGYRTGSMNATAKEFSRARSQSIEEGPSFVGP